jgi:hypothetical protein
MKLRELKNISFYKQCHCEEPDIIFVDFDEIATKGRPICHKCKKEYTYDGEEEIWDTSSQWRG